MRLIKSISWAKDFFKVSSVGRALISSPSTHVSIVSRASELLSEVLKLVVAGLLVIAALVFTFALLLQRLCFHHSYSSNPFVEDAINPSSHRLIGSAKSELE